MNYRPDIDGLRAVAVLAVVLFHADVPGFGGGFIGVDIFFVISGYLITSLLLADLRCGEFSLSRFYGRRARRILPALLMVLTAAAAAAWFLLLPEQLDYFGRSLAAASAFSSNVVFWYEAGYFDANASLKPLLHTWSLAVEEQFYLFFPLFMLLVWRLGERWLRITLAAALGVSFALCVLATPSHQAASFFLAPTRAWELLAGACLAAWPARCASTALSRVRAEAAAWAGLAAITGSILLLSESLRFPGYWPVFACVGTAVLIRTGAEGTTVSRLLGSRPAVTIGLLSYSLYLWHWVIFAFLRYYLIRPPDAVEMSLAVAASFALAAMSWRYIEGPLRRQEVMKSQRVFAAAGFAVSAALLALGVYCWQTSGAPERVPAEIAQIAAGARDRPEFDPADCRERRHESRGKSTTFQVCDIGPRKVSREFILWGDSHAMALIPAIEKLAYRDGKGGLALISTGCPPALGLERYDDPKVPTCGEFAEFALDTVRREGAGAVIIAARWPIYVEGTRYGVEAGPQIWLRPGRNIGANPAAVREGLGAVARQIREAGARLYLIGGIPEVGYDVPSTLGRKRLLGGGFDIAPSPVEVEQRQRRSWSILESVASDFGAKVLYPHRALCDGQRCLIEHAGDSLYFDDDHLSRTGARFVASALGDLSL